MSARNPELEALILEAPAEESRWLVYGDWLEEHKERRGELMSVQYRLGAVADPRARSDLQRIATQLMGLEQRRMFEGSPLAEADPSDFTLEWRLGFIEGVIVRHVGRHLSVLVERLAQDPAAAFLRRIQLRSDVISVAEDWAEFSKVQWPALESVTFTGPRSCERLFPAARFDQPRLTRLAFRSLANGDELVPHLVPLLPRLKELSITSSSLSAVGVDVLAKARPSLEVLEVGGNLLPMSAKPQLRALTRVLRFGAQHGAVGASLERGFVLFDRAVPGDLLERSVVQVAKHRGARDLFVRSATFTLGGKERQAVAFHGDSLPLDELAESLARRTEFLPRKDKFRALAFTAEEKSDLVKARAFHEGQELLSVAGALEGPTAGRVFSEFLGETFDGETVHYICDALDDAKPELLMLRGQHPVPETQRRGVFDAYFRRSVTLMSVMPRIERVTAEPAEPHEEAADDDWGAEGPCDYCGRQLPRYPCDVCEEMQVCEGCGQVDRSDNLVCPHCRERAHEVAQDDE